MEFSFLGVNQLVFKGFYGNPGVKSFFHLAETLGLYAYTQLRKCLNLDQVTGLTKTRGAIVILAEKDLAEHHGIFDDEILLRIIVHELLHVMGLGHTDYSYAYGSVMSRDPWVSETVPGVLDCAGLINLYERKRWILPLD